MAEMYRAPKSVQEEAKNILGDVAQAIRNNQPLTLKMVTEIRNGWPLKEGQVWAYNICDKVAQRASVVISTEGEAMATITGTSDLIEELNETLSDVVVFYFRAHGAHWNVKGPDFSEYHALFGEIYEDAYHSVDPIAENLRKLGAPAPFQLATFMMMSELVDANVGTDARALAADLLAANDVVLECLNDTFTCATNLNQQGIANFIAERIDSHQRWKWQLSSSLGVDVVISEDAVPAYSDEEVEEQTEPMQMMSYSEDVTKVEKRESMGEGTKVSWGSSGGTAYGKIENVNKSGDANSTEGFSLKADAKNPAYKIRIYKQKDNEWVATDVVVVHRKDALNVISDFPTSRSQEQTLMIEERKAAIATAEKITMTAEVRAIDTKDGSLRIGGYAATFNQEADGLNFREVIAPGAFTRALASNDPVFLLVNHDMEGIPLASTQSGTLQLRQDKNGLYMEAELDPANPRAQELSSALKRGDMDKMSFAFTVTPDGQTREEGLRTLTEIDRLFEVSVVTLPAYSSTTVGMRSAEEKDMEMRKQKLALKLNQSKLNRK